MMPMNNGHEKRSAKQILNWQDFMFRMGNNRELCLELLEIYLQQAPPKLREISRALDMRDFEKVSFVAHSLKGISYNLGADTVGKIADDMNSVIKENRFDALSELLLELETEFERLSDAARHILNLER